MHHDDATTADSPRMMMTELAPLLEMLAEVLCLTPPAIPSLAAAWTELATTVPKMTTLQAFQNALETMCATVVTSLPHAAGRAAVVAYWRTAVATISAQYVRLPPNLRVCDADRATPRPARPWTSLSALTLKRKDRLPVFSSADRGYGLSRHLEHTSTADSTLERTTLYRLPTTTGGDNSEERSPAHTTLARHRQPARRVRSQAEPNPVHYSRRPVRLPQRLRYDPYASYLPLGDDSDADLGGTTAAMALSVLDSYSSSPRSDNTYDHDREEAAAALIVQLESIAPIQDLAATDLDAGLRVTAAGLRALNAMHVARTDTSDSSDSAILPAHELALAHATQRALAALAGSVPGPAFLAMTTADGATTMSTRAAMAAAAGARRSDNPCGTLPSAVGATPSNPPSQAQPAAPLGQKQQQNLAAAKSPPLVSQQQQQLLLQQQQYQKMTPQQQQLFQQKWAKLAAASPNVAAAAAAAAAAAVAARSSSMPSSTHPSPAMHGVGSTLSAAARASSYGRVTAAAVATSTASVPLTAVVPGGGVLPQSPSADDMARYSAVMAAALKSAQAAQVSRSNSTQ